MIGTPQTRWREMHQSGRVAIMLEMRSSPQAGIHLTCLDGFERVVAEIVALHADEPLLGGAEDDRLVAAPAVRIAVLDLFLAQQRAARPSGCSMTSGLASQTVLPIRSSGSGPARLRRGRIGRRHRPDSNVAMPYFWPIDVIFLAVSGSGVNRAGALLERHVIAQDAERIALEKRMPEDGAFDAIARERRRASADRASRTSPP